MDDVPTPGWSDESMVQDGGFARWAELVLDRLISQEAAEIDRPHVLVLRHLDTGVTCYQGPYPDALAAAVAAERELAALADPDDAPATICTVAPLFDIA